MVHDLYYLYRKIFTELGRIELSHSQKQHKCILKIKQTE